MPLLRRWLRSGEKVLCLCIRTASVACEGSNGDGVKDDSVSGGGGGAMVAFPRPLPGTIPGNISSSVCKISEFHVALFRYVTHVSPPPPTALPPPFSSRLFRGSTVGSRRVLHPFIGP
ncbi:hypothetical protein HN011_006894 [Eciton burchellii]|nr:hypothetical protein HN011_006894 [Eciton burchellii]